MSTLRRKNEIGRHRTFFFNFFCREVIPGDTSSGDREGLTRTYTGEWWWSLSVVCTLRHAGGGVNPTNQIVTRPLATDENPDFPRRKKKHT